MPNPPDSSKHEQPIAGADGMNSSPKPAHVTSGSSLTPKVAWLKRQK